MKVFVFLLLIAVLVVVCQATQFKPVPIVLPKNRHFNSLADARFVGRPTSNSLKPIPIKQTHHRGPGKVILLGEARRSSRPSKNSNRAGSLSDLSVIKPWHHQSLSDRPRGPLGTASARSSDRANSFHSDFQARSSSRARSL